MTLIKTSKKVLTVTLCLQLAWNLSTAQSGDPSGSRVSHQQLADALEDHLSELRKKNLSRRVAMDATLRDLAEREIPTGVKEKKELARAWKLAAQIERERYGTTPYLAEALKLASELDPDDGELARNALFEAVRQEKINARIAEAQRIADAKADPSNR